MSSCICARPRLKQWYLYQWWAYQYLQSPCFASHRWTRLCWLGILVVNAPVDALDGASFLDSLQNIENFTHHWHSYPNWIDCIGWGHITERCIQRRACDRCRYHARFLPSEQMSNTRVEQSVRSTPTTVDVASVDNPTSTLLNTPAQPPVITETVPSQPVVSPVPGLSRSASATIAS